MARGASWYGPFRQIERAHRNARLNQRKAMKTGGPLNNKSEKVVINAMTAVATIQNQSAGRLLFFGPAGAKPVPPWEKKDVLLLYLLVVTISQERVEIYSRTSKPYSLS